MRKVTFDDIRLSDDDRISIIAAPVWAYERDNLFRDYRRIDGPWDEIDAELKARDERRKAAYAAKLDRWERNVDDPNLTEFQREFSGFLLYAHTRIGSEGPEPRQWAPSFSRPGDANLKTCIICGSEFFRAGRVDTCTPKCAKVRRDQTRTRGNWHRQPVKVEHEPQYCDHCGDEFLPTRKDARFCSGRCRVAAHRAQTKPPTSCE
jgi:hypothetical protein